MSRSDQALPLAIEIENTLSTRRERERYSGKDIAWREDLFLIWNVVARRDTGCGAEESRILREGNTR